MILINTYAYVVINNSGRVEKLKSLKGGVEMADSFYPFTGDISSDEISQPNTPARIAVYDSMAMTPRVVTIEPTDISTYLEEITQTVYNLVIEQGASWPFMLIREIVENFIHASFRELTISIFDRGKTLTFCDGGPGIANKKDVMRPGFSSATKAMKKYIRGVGAGLPIVAEQMNLMNGVIRIEDNIDHGTVITISIKEDEADAPISSKSLEEMGVQEKVAEEGGSVTQTVAPQQFAFQYPLPPQYVYPQQVAVGVQPYYQGVVTQQISPYPYPVSQQLYTGTVPSSNQVATQQGSFSQDTPYHNTQNTVEPHVTKPLEDLDEELVDLLLLFTSHEKVGGKEVSERLGCSPATSSRRLKELARLGYITKNRQKYTLTDEGLTKLGRISKN